MPLYVKAADGLRSGSRAWVRGRAGYIAAYPALSGPNVAANQVVTPAGVAGA
jgi:hypothetical protein